MYRPLCVDGLAGCALRCVLVTVAHTCMDCVPRSEYKYIHLTNYCQQKYAPSFEKFEAGNTLTFADFAEYLAAIPGGDGALEGTILPQIKRIICDTFRALQGKGTRLASTLAKDANLHASCAALSICSVVWLVADCFASRIGGVLTHGNGGVVCVCVCSGMGFAENGFGKKIPASQQHRFELLGYDFMVDTDLKVRCVGWGVRQAGRRRGCWCRRVLVMCSRCVVGVVLVLPWMTTRPIHRPSAAPTQCWYVCACASACCLEFVCLTVRGTCDITHLDCAGLSK